MHADYISSAMFEPLPNWESVYLLLSDYEDPNSRALTLVMWIS